MDTEVLSQAFQTTITWGVVLGLLLGKPIGIMAAIWILLKVFYRDMPTSPTIWKVLFGVALLCGIGFTMSLFIANLSFNDDNLLKDAKMGILAASLLSGSLGYYILYQSTKKQKALQKGTLGFGEDIQEDGNKIGENL